MTCSPATIEEEPHLMNDLPSGLADDPLWYKDAIIYQVHVKAYRDSSGDGYGDFGGLIEKLDYIQSLGVTCLWLLPFYPSPLKDDGYDIAEYKSINPTYGSLEDFREFLVARYALFLREIAVTRLRTWPTRVRRARRVVRCGLTCSGAVSDLPERPVHALLFGTPRGVNAASEFG